MDESVDLPVNTALFSALKLIRQKQYLRHFPQDFSRHFEATIENFTLIAFVLCVINATDGLKTFYHYESQIPAACMIRIYLIKQYNDNNNNNNTNNTDCFKRIFITQTTTSRIQKLNNVPLTPLYQASITSIENAKT